MRPSAQEKTVFSPHIGNSWYWSNKHAGQGRFLVFKN